MSFTRISSASGSVLGQSAQQTQGPSLSGTARGAPGRVFEASVFQAEPAVTPTPSAAPGSASAPGTALQAGAFLPDALLSSTSTAAGMPKVKDAVRTMLTAAATANKGQVNKPSFEKIHEELSKTYTHEVAHKALLKAVMKGKPFADKLDVEAAAFVREHAASGVLKTAVSDGIVSDKERRQALDAVKKYFGKGAANTVKGRLPALILAALNNAAKPPAGADHHAPQQPSPPTSTAPKPT
jgi:hypothetical protein